MQRIDGREAGGLRPVKITRHVVDHAEGSALIEMGKTRVLCTATVTDQVPPFLKDQGRGWITAEYGMLPRSTPERTPREAARGRIGGRTYEIQRLIGRSLRAVTDLTRLGERTVILDCDVLQADGGTRTAAVTGAFVALVDALRWMEQGGLVQAVPLRDYLAAVSVGLLEGEVLLDLCYDEDSRVQVDMNVIMTGGGRLVEVQATAEGAPFTPEEFQAMLDRAADGVKRLVALQRELLGTLRASA